MLALMDAAGLFVAVVMALCLLGGLVGAGLTLVLLSKMTAGQLTLTARALIVVGVLVMSGEMLGAWFQKPAKDRGLKTHTSFPVGNERKPENVT